MTVRCVLKLACFGASASTRFHLSPAARLHLGYIFSSVTPPDQIEREHLRAMLTRNLVECCDDCRELLREQLEREEQRAG